MVCPDCEGFGMLGNHSMGNLRGCERCDGTGQLPDSSPSAPSTQAEGQSVTSTRRLTREEWLEEPEFKGLRILDPDGWRGADAPSPDALLTFDEFNNRLMQCTIDIRHWAKGQEALNPTQASEGIAEISDADCIRRTAEILERLGFEHTSNLVRNALNDKRVNS